MDALSPPEAARYASRRARVLAQMPAGAVAVLATAPEVARNSDSDYLYRHDSYFYYLTGFTEPEATLVLVAAQGDAPRAPSCSAARKISTAKSGTATATARTVHARPSASTPRTPLTRWTKKWPLLSNVPALYYPLGGKLDARVAGWLSAVRAKSRTGVTPPAGTVDLLPLLDEMRLLKDADEQAIMQRAASISAQPTSAPCAPRARRT
jgi:Xaa-Pro aminopeptidase